MNRIDRLSAILIQLQSRRVVKAQDIAERFETSLRTVYRDIRALEEAGIPIIGEAGIGYSLMDGYRLPPVMFTREEAVAFLSAEKLVENLTDATNATNYKSAMYKIRAVLKTAEQDFLEDIDSNIVVVKNKSTSYAQMDLNLHQTILKAIAERRVLSIQYFANYNRESSERSIEPIGICYYVGYWHLIAYCRMRNGIRDFRMDRISNLTLTKDTFKIGHPTLKQYLEQTYGSNEDLQMVVIRVDNNVVRSIHDKKYQYGFVSEVEGNKDTEMTFMVNTLEGFARWYLSFGDHAKVVKPAELKEALNKLISGIQKKL